MFNFSELYLNIRIYGTVCWKHVLCYSTSECVSMLHLSQFISSMSRNSKAEAPPWRSFYRLWATGLISADCLTSNSWQYSYFVLIVCFLSTWLKWNQSTNFVKTWTKEKKNWDLFHILLTSQIRECICIYCQVKWIYPVHVNQNIFQSD